jgi:hypothetical protein
MRPARPNPTSSAALGSLGGAGGANSSYRPPLKKGSGAIGGTQQAGAATAALPATSAMSIPSFPTRAASAGPSSAPPEIRDLEIKGEADPRLTAYADKYGEHLQQLEGGKTREADVFRGQLDSDAERQIASAKESALAAGRPWTAEDESRMRSELSRGKYGALAEFELGSQRQTTEALQGGLPIASSPFQSQLAEKGFSQGTQKMLMDYAIGRGGLVSEDKKTAVMEAGQAIDAYTAFLSMLGRGGAFDFSSNYG